MSYILLGVILLVLWILQLPVVKGIIGEWRVSSILKKLDEDKYLLVNDLYIPKEDGTTSQVDHVVVSDYGIFVIETKNYSGWIFGDEKGKYWIQTIYKKKSKFLNPIIQNKGHIKALRNYLGVEQEVFIPIIVFTTSSEFKKVNVTTPVIYTIKLKAQMQSYQEVKLQEKDKQAIYNKLVSIGKATREIKKQHVQNVREIIAEDEAKDAKNDKEIEIKEAIVRQGTIEISTHKKKEELYEALKVYRLEKSKEENIKPYLIYNNAELEALVKAQPKTLEELMKIRGFGKMKCEKYGKDILYMLANYI